MRTLLFLLPFFFLSLSQPLWAYESAVRLPDEDWQTALEREIQKASPKKKLFFESTETALNRAEYYTPNFDVRSLPEWGGTAVELQTAFEKVRDERIYPDSNRPGFSRRSTWLFPDDGCYVRAAHASRMYQQLGRPAPGRVFAFGRLRAKTNFASSGTVWWSYHTAAAYRIGNQALVTDPAVDPHQPLFLEQWLARIAKDVNQVRIAVCDTNAYSPSRVCFGGKPISEKRFLNHQKAFFDDEWSRVRSVNMNPERLLGNEPPWTRLIFGPYGLAVLGLN